MRSFYSLLPGNTLLETFDEVHNQIKGVILEVVNSQV